MSTQYKRKISGAQKGPRKTIRKTAPKAPLYFSRGEKKFHDLDVDDAVIDAAGTIQTSLLTIAEGNGESNRVGRKIVIKSLHWRGLIGIPATATSGGAAADITRLIVYQDKQTNGAAATVLNILETANIHSFLNLSNSGRFVILFDRQYANNSQGAGGNGTTNFTSENQLAFQWNKTLEIPVEYDNSVTTGAIGSIRSNNIGMLFISSAGTTVVDSKFRVRYTDF